VVRGWEACVEALSTPTLVSDPSFGDVERAPTNNLLQMEGNAHKRLRRLLAPYFAPSRVREIRPKLEKLSALRLVAIREESDVDLIADLAEPIVLEGILSAMGVRDERRSELGGLANQMLGWLEPDLPPAARRRVNAAALRATALFTQDSIEGRASGLHATLEVAARAGTISPKLARSTPVVVLHGGYENPLNYLGCLTAWAAADPERFARVAGSTPALLCDEILRVFSPVRHLWRWTVSEGVGDIQPAARPEKVWIDLESAHSDPHRFASLEVDVSSKQRHLGFGYGRHGCPGATLARLQAGVLTRCLLRLPAEELARFSPQWRDGFVARGPAIIKQR
jgi:cytochrome P450